jgi:sarcosine oxidase/L-pipecolate oxidase
MNKNQCIHIVGAGEFGLTTALALINRGYKNIKVYDRLEPPAIDGSSAGMNRAVRQDYGSDTFHQELAVSAIEKWKEWSRDSMLKLNKKLYHETGIFLASETDAFDTYEHQSFDNLKKSGYNDNLILCRDIPLDGLTGFGQFRKNLPFGYFNKLGGWVNPEHSLRYLIHLLKMNQVEIKYGDSGTLVELIRNLNGIITGIRMKDGSIHNGCIFLCTGAWTASILNEAESVLSATGQPLVEIKLPDHLKEYFGSSCPFWAASISRLGYYGFPPVDGVIKIGLHGAGYAYFHDGAPTPKTAITHPQSGSQVPLEFIQNLRGFLQDHFPLIADLDISKSYMCWYCDSVDGDFFISKVPGQPNVIIAAGGSGHAFKFAPMIGDIVVDAYEGIITPATKRYQWRVPNKEKKEMARRRGEKAILNSIQLVESSELNEITKKSKL